MRGATCSASGRSCTSFSPDDPRTEAGDLDEIWDQAREGRVTAPRELKRSISRSLERVCMKALAADPARRFTSAAEFQRALRRERRRPFRFVGAARFAAAVLGGLVAMAIPPRPRTDSPASPVQALSGELSVKVWSEVEVNRRGIDVAEQGALPVRSGELVHLRSHQPAGLSLCALARFEGTGRPAAPLGQGFPDARHGRVPLTHLDCPPELNGGLRIKGPSGLETALLLARRTPLPEKTDLAGLIGLMPPSPLRNPQELTVARLRPRPAGRGDRPALPPRPEQRSGTN